MANIRKDIYKYETENRYKYFIKKVSRHINAFQSIIGLENSHVFQTRDSSYYDL